MGLQYIAKEGMFEGDRGGYMIKFGRLRYDSIEKLIRNRYFFDGCTTRCNHKGYIVFGSIPIHICPKL